MLDLAPTLSQRREVRGHAAWPGHETATGWGVFGLPFDSGHVLALRAFPENDFAAHRTLWHRDPQGKWATYVDCPRLHTVADPRRGGVRASPPGDRRSLSGREPTLTLRSASELRLAATSVAPGPGQGAIGGAEPWVRS
jgi:hypothetical protein